MNITNDIRYVGVNDHQIDLFEGQYSVPNGMSYNSYMIFDKKIAVMDSVDINFGEEWINKIKKELEEAGKAFPDYIVVHHMEMDHSANIALFMQTFPQTKIVSSKIAFVIMRNYLGTDYAERQVVISEGDVLELGKHKLNFISAPNVHWPEVMFSYDTKDKVLFSADAFGKFGALDIEEKWEDEARRYYFGIVGKFGDLVQNVLQKLSDIEIKKICPLHGPVLEEDVSHYVDLYDKWSSYTSEKDGVFIAYTSVYGNTKKVAENLASILKEKGCNVITADLSREDWAKCVGNAFCYSKLVLASTTYCGGVFPKMREFIEHLTERNFQNRTIAFMENGTWNPICAKLMSQFFSDSKDMKFIQNRVTIKTAFKEENEPQMQALVSDLLNDC